MLTFNFETAAKLAVTYCILYKILQWGGAPAASRQWTGPTEASLADMRILLSPNQKQIAESAAIAPLPAPYGPFSSTRHNPTRPQRFMIESDINIPIVGKEGLRRKHHTWMSRENYRCPRHTACHIRVPESDPELLPRGDFVPGAPAAFREKGGCGPEAAAESTDFILAQKIDEQLTLKLLTGILIRR